MNVFSGEAASAAVPFRIIISGGGTGGHIFPAIAIANEVKRRKPDAEILFVGAENRMDMLQNADSALRRALIESGFILSTDTENPPVNMILGLYYQEKARLIASAATRNAKVYAEFTDGRTIIGRASKAEDPGHVIIDGEDVDIAKIWKTAELPLSVKSIRTEGVPSDSDSL